MSFWFEVKKSAIVFKSNPMQPLSNQLKLLHFDFFFNYLSDQIFESPVIWTQLWILHTVHATTSSMYITYLTYNFAFP